MPFNSIIDVNRRLVVTTGTSILNGDEGLRCCEQLKKRPDFDPAFNQQLDPTSATRFDATSVQVQAIAAQRLFSRESRRAIVASQPAICGLARMYESYRALTEVGERIRVFNELGEALEWLDGSS
jgi:hypothetical protein